MSLYDYKKEEETTQNCVQVKLLCCDISITTFLLIHMFGSRNEFSYISSVRFSPLTDWVVGGKWWGWGWGGGMRDDSAEILAPVSAPKDFPGPSTADSKLHLDLELRSIYPDSALLLLFKLRSIYTDSTPFEITVHIYIYIYILSLIHI